MSQSAHRAARRKAAALLAAAAGILAAAPAFAASDYLLELDGVKGESKATAQIEIESFSWGATNPSAACPGRTGAGTLTVTPTRVSDGATLQLSGGTTGSTGVIKKAIMFVRKQGADHHAYQIELENVMVTSLTGAARSMRYERASCTLAAR